MRLCSTSGVMESLQLRQLDVACCDRLARRVTPLPEEQSAQLPRVRDFRSRALQRALCYMLRFAYMCETHIRCWL